MEGPSVEETPIPGLLLVRLPVHQDARGWFKEGWQREKMVALGLPDFQPVQHNVSFNLRSGVTRGLHAEPWDKLLSVASGRIFAAWVDLREGPTFGRAHHQELTPSTAVFVPRGVGNAYQALEAGTACTYLVTDHFRSDASYPALALDDPTAAIPWPIPLEEAEVSDKDRRSPHLAAVDPVLPRRTLVLGAHGQLGRALVDAFPEAHAVDRPDLDVTDECAMRRWPWADYEVVVNAAAFTAVDEAETPAGRRAAWAVNARAPATLASLSQRHGFVLVHYSSDYVFDGASTAHDEAEALSPLSAYGQSKAAGDLAVTTTPHHYLIRTSWLVGEGHNFVRTMIGLASSGVSPSVVDDQLGRLTFTDEVARATRHLLLHRPERGTYNCTNTGPVTSWADVARAVFAGCGRSVDDITAVSTPDYAAGKELAPRPAHSLLDLSKLVATGFRPEEAAPALSRYLSRVTAASER